MLTVLDASPATAERPSAPPAASTPSVAPPAGTLLTTSPATHVQFWRERVARGAQLLDAKCPGWHQRLADRHIVVSDPTRCVLFHLYGDWFEWAIGLSFGCEENGFCCLPPDDALLRELWSAEIVRRLQAVPA